MGQKIGSLISLFVSLCLTFTRASLTLSRLELSKLSPFCLNSAFDTWVQPWGYKHDEWRGQIKHSAPNEAEAAIHGVRIDKS